MPTQAHAVSTDLVLRAMRAALAAHFCKTHGLSVAGRHSEIDRGHLGFLSAVPAIGAGIPLAEAIQPIAYLMKNAAAIATGSDLDSRQGISIFDQQIDDQMAFLQDSLLNPLLPFEAIAPAPPARDSTNRVYEKILTTSRFASRDRDSSAALAAAEQLLFDEDDDGVRHKSRAWEVYDTLADAADSISEKLENAETAGNQALASRLRADLDAALAEWRILGRQAEIEAAIERVRHADNNETFETARAAFLKRLRGRLRARLNGATPYAMSTLVPISPLLRPEDHPAQWPLTKLSGRDILALLDAHPIPELLDHNEHRSEIEQILHVHFRAFKVTVGKDWRSNTFFEAGFWRREGVVSDGRGSGSMPTEAEALLFVRDVQIAVDGGWVIHPSDVPPDPGADTPTMVAHTEGLIKARDGALITDESLKQLVSNRMLFEMAPQATMPQPGFLVPRVFPQFLNVSIANTDAFKNITAVSSIAKIHGVETAIRAKPSRASSREQKFPGAKRKAKMTLSLRCDDDPDQLNTVTSSVRYLYIGGHESNAIGMRYTRLNTHVLTHETERSAFMAAAMIRDGMVKGIDPARWKEKLPLGYRITFHTAVGAQHDEYVPFPPEDGEETVKIELTLTHRVNHLQASGTLSPALFGWSLSLTPPCPRPDPDLSWT